MKGLVLKLILKFLGGLNLSISRCLGYITGRILIIAKTKTYRYTFINLSITHAHFSQNQLKKITNQAVINSTINFFEMPVIWNNNKDWLLKKLKSVHGKSNLLSAVTKKNGVIIIMPHIGNWEFFGKYTSLIMPMISMYQPPKLSQLDSHIKSGRESLGAVLVPTNKSGIKKILKSLKKNNLVAILPDQVPQEGSGIYSKFFSKPAYTMTLVHNLVKRTSCEVIMGYAIRDHGGFNVFYDHISENIKSLDQEESIDTMNLELQKTISKFLTQYEWSYKRFKKQPVGGGNPYKKN